MKPRILSLLLCLLLLLSLVFPVHADLAVEAGYSQPKGEDLLEVKLQIHSNLSSRSELEGLYFDNVFYIDYQAVCELTGSRIFSQDSAQVVFSMHGGLRKITVTEDCRLTESFGKDKFFMDIPTALWNAKLYISAPHILRYMGADVGFAVDADASTHMSVSMPYTVLDLYEEFQDNGGYRFTWSEAEGKFVDPELIKYFSAIGTVYFGYDSHLVIQGLSESYSELVMEELYRDVVLQVIRTSGAGLVQTEASVLDLLGSVSGELLVTDAWINAVMAAADFEGADALISDILSQGETVLLDDVAGGAKTFIKITGGIADALQTVIQYSGVNSAQRDVLANSLNRVTVDSGVYARSPNIFKAAKLAQEMIDGEQLAAERSAKKILFDVAVDQVTGMIPIVSTVASAAEVASSTVQSIPFFQELLSADEAITVAAISAQISSLGNTLLTQDYGRVSLSPAKGIAYQQYTRADILLCLKASLLTRQQLIGSGVLTDYAAEAMEAKNQHAAQLLNKGENAQYVQIESPRVDEDLTWIAKLAGKGLMGTAVISGQYIYYWQHQEDSFTDGAYFSEFGFSGPATLVRRDSDGSEEALFDANAQEFVITATGIFYSTDGMICSRSFDGSDYKEWTGGVIRDVDPYGNYLVYVNDGVYYSLNTRSGESIRLFEGGSFQGSHRGVVYYSVEVEYSGYDDPEYANAQNGKVILRAVNMDGTGDRHMATTKPDLYGNYVSGYSTAYIQHLRFGEDGLYFSYGSIAGTGMFFQGGKIMFVSYDGTESRVVAGEPELVDANFGIREDGSVSTSTDQDFLFYDSDLDFFTYYGKLYWMDPVTGISRELISTDAFDAENADRYGIASAAVWGDRAVFTVHYSKRDPSQDFGWREYTVRTHSIVYLLDLESGSLTELYRF